MKVCKKCGEEKEITEFDNNKTNKDKLSCYCKACNKILKKEYYEKNKSKIIEKNNKHRKSKQIKKELKDETLKNSYYEINKEKLLIRNKEYRENNKEYLSNQKKEYYINNREIILEKRKEYRKNNKEKFKEKDKNYQINNREKVNKYNSKYRSERKKIDNLFKIKDSIRILIYTTFNTKGYKKKLKTEKILGCEFSFFKQYIELKFKDEMTWENYGTWHLDHIIPISYANTEKEIYELNHYTNFQPLWASENMIKGNRWVG